MLVAQYFEVYKKLKTSHKNQIKETPHRWNQQWSSLDDCTKSTRIPISHEYKIHHEKETIVRILIIVKGRHLFPIN
jgi:hypothetical protein